MGITKVFNQLVAKGTAILVGSASVGFLTVKSGTAFTGPTTFTGSLNVTGALRVLGNLTVASRFIGTQGVNQGTAVIPVGSTWVAVTTGAVSSQTAYALSMVTAAASSRLLGPLTVDSVVAGTSFAIVASAPSPEALDVRWKIQG